MSEPAPNAARARILGSIRDGLGRGPLDATKAAALDARLAAGAPNLVPERAQLPHPQQVELFVAEAERLAATVVRLPDLAAVPAAVAEYLSGLNLPAEIRIAPDPALASIDWSHRPLLKVTSGPARPLDLVGLTSCFAGIAETGTLLTLSSAERPATLNFMPDHHLVVLQARDIVGPMEAAFARIRALAGPVPPGKAAPVLPRTVNMISGPSRTADIDSQLVMGAHGPRRLHILLIDLPSGQAFAQVPPAPSRSTSSGPTSSDRR